MNNVYTMSKQVERRLIMKQIGVRFHDSTESVIDEIVNSIGFDKSKVARAAMNYGLRELMKNIDSDNRQQSINIIGCDMSREAIKDCS